MQPPEGPPVCTAFTFFEVPVPSPIPYTNCSSVDPSGSSTNPVFFTFPTNENTFVPGLFSVPVSLNQSLPFSSMTGILHHVSTLLILVGFPYNPFPAG